MVDICEKFGKKFSITFNEKKTECILFSKGDSIPEAQLTLHGKKIPWSRSAKHLGNQVDDKLNDILDIKQKKGHFVSSINKVISKFYGAPFNVKCRLFQMYCTSLYGCQTWDISSKNIDVMCKTWNKCIRRLLGLPYNTHTRFLPYIIGFQSGRCNIDLRLCRYVKLWLKSKNKLLLYFLDRAFYMDQGIISNSIKYLCHTYNLTKREIFYGPWSFIKRKIQEHYVIANEELNTVNQIKELLQCSIKGFSKDEVDVLLAYLCT